VPASVHVTETSNGLPSAGRCGGNSSGAVFREGRPIRRTGAAAARRRRTRLLDRLGRAAEAAALRAEAGVGLFLHQQGLDTTTASGRAMYGMMGVFAEYERAMIRERVNAGLSRARAEGKRLGRPRVGADLERRVRELRTAGDGLKLIARKLGMGVGTVQRIDRETRERAASRPTSGDGHPTSCMDP
jgi:DNA invertase Pin-like site-specific DNA recombinase